MSSVSRCDVGFLTSFLTCSLDGVCPAGLFGAEERDHVSPAQGGHVDTQHRLDAVVSSDGLEEFGLPASPLLSTERELGRQETSPSTQESPQWLPAAVRSGAACCAEH